MNITGKQIINGSYVAKGNDTFNSMNASLGIPRDIIFFEATDEEVSDAVNSAYYAFKIYKHTSHSARAAFLKTIASEIEALGEDLIETASTETGLGTDRLKGERQRTINQLHAFAKFIEDARWVKPIIDAADPLLF